MRRASSFKYHLSSSKEEKILVAGFGGQGVMFLGKTLAWAATKEGRFTTWIPSYGAEMRGGTAHCFVKISSQKIASPIFEHPTSFFIFNQPSWDKFMKRIGEDSLVIVNSSLVKPTEIKKASIKEVPLNQLALDLGSLKVANIIALGVFLRNKDILKSGTIEEVLKEGFLERRELLELNLKALHLGLNYG
jgi:2-oxoglutarate ferredoxin oxidoreductase subunit gamma